MRVRKGKHYVARESQHNFPGSLELSSSLHPSNLLSWEQSDWFHLHFHL